jgi:hypothetical protein
MKLRVSSLFALILLSLGLVVLVSPAPPAWACSCALSEQEQDARADLIVTGTVTEVSDSGIRLAVESVEKGTGAADTVRLKVGRSEASCGYEFRAGGRYRVNSLDGQTGLCTGVSPLPAASATTTTAPAAGPTPATTLASPAPDPSRAGWWLAAGVAAATLAAGVVIVARRRRRAD